MNNGKLENVRRRRTIALTSAGAIAVAGLAFGVNAAMAATPTWSPADPNLVGTINLYNAAGQEVTSGSLANGQIAAYAVGSSVLPGSGTTATLYAYTPTSSGGTPTVPGDWTGYQLTPNTVAPASPPAGLPTGKPIVTIDPAATTLGQYVTAYPSTVTTAGYANTYELRLRTGGPGGSIAYDAVDIVVNGNNWAVAGTNTAVSTTTTLAVTPPGASAGSTLTLTATVAPSAAAGTVEFFDGATSLGTIDVASGSAVKTTPAVAGSHSFTAVFTPSDASAYATSTSTPVTYQVSSGVTTTTTAIGAAPAAPKVGGTVKIAAVVSPAVAGKVQFSDGTKAIGAPVTVVSGKASVSTVPTTVGKHTYKAVFTPTDASAYTSSSKTVAVTVAKATSAVAETLPKKVKKSKQATVSVVVSAPGVSVTGTVTILDGTTKLGTAKLSGGAASFKLPKLSKGKHTITVSFAGSATVAASSASKSIKST